MYMYICNDEVPILNTLFNLLSLSLSLSLLSPFRQQIEDLEGKVKSLKEQLKKKEENESKYQGQSSLPIQQQSGSYSPDDTYMYMYMLMMLCGVLVQFGCYQHR